MAPEIARERYDRFMTLQAEISAEKLSGKIGRTIPVLIDGVDEDGAVGRSGGDAPEIDGLVYVEDGEGLEPGDLVDVEIRSAEAYDLWGTVARAGD